MSAPRDEWALAFEISDHLPKWFNSSETKDRFPEELQGASIIKIGTPINHTDRLEGGGLVIDFIPHGQTSRKRLVLAFNELGMWIEALV
jgi:hypothetical protein